MVRLRFALTVATIAFVAYAASAFGQANLPTNGIGNQPLTPAAGDDHDYIQLLSESVNPANGSVSLAIRPPVPPGRGLTPSFAFSYNSAGLNVLNDVQGGLVWSSNTGGNYSAAYSWQSSGFPYMTWQVWQTKIPYGEYNNEWIICNFATGFTFVDLRGVSHTLNIGAQATDSNSQGSCGSGLASPGGDSQVQAVLGANTLTNLAEQNSGISVTVTDSSGTVYTFGTGPGFSSYVVPASTVEDRNGNFLTQSKDTASRTLPTYSFPGLSGVTSATIGGLTYTVGTTVTSIGNFSPSYQFALTNNAAYCPIPTGGALPSTSGSVTNISTITLPNGKKYSLSYGGTNPYGMISQITYPTGGWVKYSWALSPSYAAFSAFPGLNSNQTQTIQNGCLYRYQVPVVTQRQVSFDGTTVAETQGFSYTTTWSTNWPSNPGNWGTKTATVTTTDNVLNKSFTTTYSYLPQLIPSQPMMSWCESCQIPLEQTIQYNDWSGSPLKLVTKGWYDQFHLACEFETLQDVSPNISAGTFYQYQYDQVSDKREYDFGQISPATVPTVCNNTVSGPPASPTPLRETTTTFQSFTGALQNTFNRPATIITYGGGSRAAETDFAYDGTAVSSVTATQHDDTNYGTTANVRGNVTSQTRNCFFGSTNCTNAVTKYTYDDTGQIATIIDPCGNASCSDVLGSTNHTTIYSFADSYSSGTPPSNTNTYLTNFTNALGHTASFTYGYTDGKMTSSTDANSQTTHYKYGIQPAGCSTQDTLDRIGEIDYPDLGKTTFCYNDAAYNQSTPSPSITTTKAISSGTNEVSVQAFDGLWHPVENILSSDPSNPTYSVTTYYGTGKPYKTYNPTRCSPPTTNCGSEPTWGVTTFSYDGVGRTTQVTQPDSSTLVTAHTGRATQVSDEGNGTRSVKRISQVDGLGRLVSVCEVTSTSLVGITGTPGACGQDITATGFLTSYHYDALDNMLGVTQGGVNPRSFTYDSLSRLLSAVNPESGSISYSYDVNGNVSQRVASKGFLTEVTTTYQYDVLNRLTKKGYSDGTPSAVYYYDQANPWGASVTNYVGRLTQTASDNFLAGSIFSYDAIGRVVNQWQCTPLTCGTSAVYLTFTYDLLGDLTSSVNNADNVTYTYAYDAAARLTSLKSNYVDNQHPGTLVSFGSFNPLQKPGQVAYGNGITDTLTYDNRGRISALSQTGLYSFSIQHSSSTGYAPNGNILYSNDSVNGNWAYSYDDFNRLIAGTCSANCPLETAFTYTYDRFGNRWTESVTGTGIQPSYTFDANNHITTSGILYDAAGNVIQDGLGTSYTYDAENRIITATNSANTASYIYDAEGHRVRATVNGQTRDFVYDLGGRNVDEFVPGGSGWLGTWARGEVYAGGMHVATYASSTTEFDNSDWLSTFRMRSDVSGNKIESCTSLPFGEDLNCTGPEVTPIHFTGKERDSESGNDFFGARYYTSTMGRFMTADWAAKPTAVPYAHYGNPQSLNLYAYVNDNPTTVADPDGHAPWGFGGWGACEGSAQQCQSNFQKEAADAWSANADKAAQDKAVQKKKDPPPAQPKDSDTSKKPGPSAPVVAVGAGLAPQASGAANAAKDAAKNFMKSTKPDPPLRGAPSEAPNVTELSPERQLVKDAVDTLGDLLSGVASGATEILVPLVAAPAIKPPPQADPTNPVCLCTT